MAEIAEDVCLRELVYAYAMWISRHSIEGDPYFRYGNQRTGKIIRGRLLTDTSWSDAQTLCAGVKPV